MADSQSSGKVKRVRESQSNADNVLDQIFGQKIKLGVRRTAAYSDDCLHHFSPQLVRPPIHSVGRFFYKQITHKVNRDAGPKSVAKPRKFYVAVRIGGLLFRTRACLLRPGHGGDVLLLFVCLQSDWETKGNDVLEYLYSPHVGNKL